MPVQWSSYIDGVGKYQGRLLYKGTVQQAFYSKVKKYSGRNDLLELEEWRDLRAVFEAIFAAFDEEFERDEPELPLD